MKNTILWTGIVILMASFVVNAAQTNELTSTIGDIIINSTSGNIFLKPNDPDDYLSYSLVSDESLLKAIGSDFILQTDQAQANFEFQNDDSVNQQIVLRVDKDYSQIRLVTDDSESLVMTKFNATDATYPRNFLIRNNDTDGVILLMPNNDNGDYIQFSSDATNPFITSIGDGDLNLYTDGGNIHIKAGADTTDYVRFSTSSNIPRISLFSPNGGYGEIFSSQEIHLIPSNDLSDYLNFQTINNIPTMTIVGDQNFRINSTIEPLSSILFGFQKNTSRIIFYPNNDRTIVLNAFEDVDGEQDGLEISSNGAGMRYVYPDTDNAWMLGTGSRRWADIQSVLIQGSDICFMAPVGNEICMVECENEQNQQDICFVLGKVTETERHKIALIPYETFTEYQNNHMKNGTYDNTLTEEEFNTYRSEIITPSGNVDVTFGRPVKMNLKDVKNSLDKLDNIETETCSRDPTWSWC